MNLRPIKNAFKTIGTKNWHIIIIDYFRYNNVMVRSIALI